MGRKRNPAKPELVVVSVTAVSFIAETALREATRCVVDLVVDCRERRPYRAQAGFRVRRPCFQYQLMASWRVSRMEV